MRWPPRPSSGRRLLHQRASETVCGSYYYLEGILKRSWRCVYPSSTRTIRQRRIDASAAKRKECSIVRRVAAVHATKVDERLRQARGDRHAVGLGG